MSHSCVRFHCFVNDDVNDSPPWKRDIYIKKQVSIHALFCLVEKPPFQMFSKSLLCQKKLFISVLGPVLSSLCNRLSMKSEELVLIWHYIHTSTINRHQAYIFIKIMCSYVLLYYCFLLVFSSPSEETFIICMKQNTFLYEIYFSF